MAPRGETPQSEHRRLIVTLRQAREARQLTQKDVADALEWSTSKLIRIEKGSVGISITDLKALLSHYEINDPDEVDDMVGMARASKKADWWQKYREVIPQDFYTFLRLEASAVRMRQFQSLVVPGILQSPEYIKALIRDAGATPEQLQRGLEVRVKRQELISEEGPELFFILDESVLYRTVGGAAAMREQLLRLREVGEHPRASIRILPFSAGVLRAMKNSYEILELSADLGDYVLLVEHAYKDHLMQVPSDETRQYVGHFSTLERIARSEEETRHMIEQRLKEIEKD